MDNPFFSIVVAVYNAEEFLDELIQSVIKQTYEEWELILVNDGSTDNSGSICDKYSGKEKIKAFHTENQGGLEARYYGIKRSVGNYVIVIDADDRIVPECLMTVKEAITKSGSDMIMWRFRSFGNVFVESGYSLEPLRIYKKKEILYISIMDTCHALWLRAIRGDIIRNSCICPLKHLSMNTDYAMVVPIMCRTLNCYVIEDILYEYRIYEKSVSHYGTAQKIIDTGKVTEYVEKEIIANGLFDIDLERAIYVSYLKMIAGRLLSLFLHGAISMGDCEIIHLQNSYIKAEKYENTKNLNIITYYIMRTFRKKRYWMFRMFKIVEVAKDIMHLLKKTRE